MFSVSCKILSAIRYESDRLRGLALTLRPAGQAHTMRVRRYVRAWLKRVNFVRLVKSPKQVGKLIRKTSSYVVKQMLEFNPVFIGNYQFHLSFLRLPPGPLHLPLPLGPGLREGVGPRAAQPRSHRGAGPGGGGPAVPGRAGRRCQRDRGERPQLALLLLSTVSSIILGELL